MLLYVDLLSDVEVCSDSYPTIQEAKGAVLGFESKKIVEGAVDVDTGANASAEDGAEELDDNAETFINIVRAHGLVLVELSKKEYKAFMKAYWKKLLKKLNRRVYDMAGFPSDYEPDSDKKTAKAELEAKVAELSKYDLPTYEAAKAQVKSFRDNFEALQAFVKEYVAGNWDEFEIYMPEGGELGECLLVPARYVGEAESPTFFVIVDGCKQQKE